MRHGKIAAETSGERKEDRMRKAAGAQVMDTDGGGCRGEDKYGCKGKGGRYQWADMN